MASILLSRIQKERDLRTRSTQGGFRPGRGCIDQLFTIRRILEHGDKFQQSTAACFIDFSTAFDSVNRESLWDIMIVDGVPSKLVRLAKAYYANTKACVRIGGEESNAFELMSGVRQG